MRHTPRVARSGPMSRQRTRVTPGSGIHGELPPLMHSASMSSQDGFSGLKGTERQLAALLSTWRTSWSRFFARILVWSTCSGRSRTAGPILEKAPASEFEWLFLAQHYGLPTRLLDWSSNPLVGLFFATERHDDKDGALHYLQHAVTDQYHLLNYRTATYPVGAKEILAIQPEQGKVVFVRPRYSDARYVNQRSVLSCPADPFQSLDVPGLKKLTIKGPWKGEIRKRLRVLGVSTSFIYPGLGGVAAEIKSSTFDPIVAGRAKMISARGTMS
ncbi:FRG domain-containing protein [Variovorax sp. RO1]|nr:FRG domain-containing protein [Variovorax sp. RO1]